MIDLLRHLLDDTHLSGYLGHGGHEDLIVGFQITGRNKGKLENVRMVGNSYWMMELYKHR